MKPLTAAPYHSAAQRVQAAASLAVLPLYAPVVGGQGALFGALVLASPDSQRFQNGMGTEFLERIAEICGAALARLR